MHGELRIAAIIPALDEEQTIGPVVAAVDRELVGRVIVVDNGSSDRTAARAASAGAEVVRESRRGYGAACLAGIRCAADVDLLVFLDGDGSDDPREIPLLVNALIDGPADLVIGSRELGERESGALTVPQRLGNRLACGLIHWLWGVRYTDLGPFRVIRRPVQEALAQSDLAFGWTVEMQIKAAQAHVAVAEVPVSTRLRKGGRSKVSGNLGGALRAGRGILGTIVRAKLSEIWTRA